MECVDVAAQAYHLVNAIDAGVKGHALDINNILQDYIKRLNQYDPLLHLLLPTHILQGLVGPSFNASDSDITHRPTLQLP